METNTQEPEVRSKKSWSKKWKDTHYLNVYLLAKQGMTRSKICQTLGANPLVFKSWLQSNPAFKEAYEKGRAMGTGNNDHPLREYVYGKLPPHLKKFWDDLDECETEQNGIVKWEALLADAGRKTRMHLFFYALVSCSFNVSNACAKVGISVTNFQNWVNKYPEFAEILDEFHVHKKNFFEEKLVNLVASGDSPATIFVNRTFNRDRGYNEKVELEVTGGAVNHNLIDVSTLPLDLRRAILNHLRGPSDPPAIEYKKEGGTWVPDDEDTDTTTVKVMETPDEDEEPEDDTDAAEEDDEET